MNSSYLEGEGDDEEDEDDTSISLSAIKKNYKPGAKRGKDFFLFFFFFFFFSKLLQRIPID